jgi:hypothetical protein
MNQAGPLDFSHKPLVVIIFQTGGRLEERLEEWVEEWVEERLEEWLDFPSIRTRKPVLRIPAHPAA